MITKISQQRLRVLPLPIGSILKLFALVVLAGQVGVARADNATGITGNGNALENRQPTLVVRYIIAVDSGIFPDNPQGTPTQGTPPNRAQPFLGEIKAVSFDFAPRGWRLCEGQLLPINQNQALFSLLGTNFGGNGVTTFGLPDLRGRVPIGAGQGPGMPNYDLAQQVGNATPILSVANLPIHTHTLPGGGNTQPAGYGAPIDNRQPALALHFLIAANGEIMIVPWSQQPTGWTRCDSRMLPSATHQFLFNNIGATYGGSATNFALPDLRGRLVVGDDNGGLWPRGLASGSNETVLAVADMKAHTHTLSSGSTGSTGSTGTSANNYQPSLVLRWMISLFGVFPSPKGGLSFPCIGEMRLIAGATASGLSSDAWAPLFGQLYSTTENDTFFFLIGTTYGGDGQETFAVPDLRGRIDVSASPSFVVGENLGSPALAVDIATMAPHVHLVDLGITAIQHFGNGSATITLTGMAGSSSAVDKSDDLVTWTNLGPVQFESGTQTITDPNPTLALKRFYRARP